MKNLTWQNPEQLFVAQELINKVKSKCCGIKDENKVVRLFIDGGLGFSTQKVKGLDSVNGFEIGFKPGIAIKLNDKFSVLAKCGFLGYRDDYMDTESGYGFGFTSEDLSVGFHYEF